MVVQKAKDQQTNGASMLYSRSKLDKGIFTKEIFLTISLSEKKKETQANTDRQTDKITTSARPFSRSKGTRY